MGCIPVFDRDVLVAFLDPPQGRICKETADFERDRAFRNSALRPIASVGTPSQVSSGEIAGSRNFQR